MANIAILPSSSVEILYWEGSPSFQKTENGTYVIGPSFGHVAIQAGEQYISFWPGRCGQEKSKYCAQITAHFHEYDTDSLVEGKPPDNRIRLDTLEVDKIIACYNKFKEGNKYDWKIFGSSSFSKPHERNCAGLSLYLLEAGDIRKLVPGTITKNPKTIFITLSISTIIFGALCYGSYRILSPLLKARDVSSICLNNYRNVSNFDIEMHQNLKKLHGQISNLHEPASQMQSLFTNSPLEEVKALSNFHLPELTPLISITQSMTQREIERNHSLVISNLASLVDNVEMRSIIGIFMTTVGLLGYFTFTGNKALMQVVTPADVKNLAIEARAKELRKNEHAPSSFSWKFPALLVAGIGGAFFFFNQRS